MNKYKKFLVCLCITALLVTTAVFVGCNSASGDFYPSENGYYDEKYTNSSADLTYAEEGSVSERKIIYTITARLSVDNVAEAVKKANNLLNADEWVQASSEEMDYSRMVFRIKTSRIDEFIESIKAIGELENLEKDSKEVSLDYYDNTLEKQSLLNEQTRLNELLTTADSVSEIIQINERLTKIDKRLMEINGTLKEYDSLVEYSKVTVSFAKRGTAYVEPTFGEILAEGYKDGWEFAKGLIIGLLVALPFIIVIGGIVVGIIFAVKAIRKKRGYTPFKNIAQSKAPLKVETKPADSKSEHSSEEKEKASEDEGKE